jgi:chemotaxis protein histidine kinase CheA
VDLSRYRNLFIEESVRLLKEARSNLSSEPDPLKLMRCFHTIKGMGATMRFGAITLLAHALEDICDALKKGNLPQNQDTTAILLLGVGGLQSQVEQVSVGLEPERHSELEARIHTYLTSGRTTDFTLISSLEDEPTIELEVPLVDTAGDRAEAGIAEIMAACASSSMNTSERLLRIAQASRRVHEAIVELRAVRFGVVAAPLRRRVRDLAMAQGSEIRVEITGEELKLDPAVLASLQGALTHLLTNAVLHGIEKPDERRDKGKEPMGTIRVLTERQGNQLGIRIADDGRGMDVAALQKAARSSSDDPVSLAFLPGVSTAKTIDHNAGRGLGLSSAAHTIEVLGGQLDARTTIGRGTTFYIRTPLRPSIQALMLFTQGPYTLAVPRDLAQVESGPSWEAPVIPPLFPFNLLPGILGTTFDAEGGVVFVVDPTCISGLAPLP